MMLMFIHSWRDGKLMPHAKLVYYAYPKSNKLIL